MEHVHDAQPAIPKIILKRSGGNYRISKSKSKRSKRKHSKKSLVREFVGQEFSGSESKIYHDTRTQGVDEIVVIDSSDEDENLKSLTPASNQKYFHVIDIDSSDKEGKSSMYGHERNFQEVHSASLSLTREIPNGVQKSVASTSHYVKNGNDQNVQTNLIAASERVSNKVNFVDLSLDDDNNNVHVEAQTFENKIPIDGELDQELEMIGLVKKEVLIDLTHLSDLMYLIINSRRDYSSRVMRIERLCVELVSKERTIAEDSYKNSIAVDGRKFTQLFSKMESKFENLHKDSFLIYNFIVFRLFVGVNKIDCSSRISLELVKNLMILLLKRNSLKSPVFDVFREESAEDCLLEFESSFLDSSFPEAFIPIED